ncbi:hypothetical protein L828_0664 [Mycobacteroides abscessus MAB_030201_1061]|nr:hypothetical protein L828_0664 [Mycobacteroides abscessus MAB_030201_1061]
MDSVQITVAVVRSAIAAVGATAVGAAERGLEFWVHRVRSRRGLSPIENFGA